MDFDFSGIISFLSAIDPKAAAIGAAVLWVVQRTQKGEGLGVGKGGLLSLLQSVLGGLGLGGKSATPVAPTVPVPVPTVPVPQVPGLPASDPLANRPILKAIRDGLLGSFHQKVTSVLDKGEDVEKAVKLYSAIVTEAEAGPFVGPGPVAK